MGGNGNGPLHLVGARADIDRDHAERRSRASLAMTAVLYVRVLNYGWLLAAWLQVRSGPSHSPIGNLINVPCAF